MDNIDTNAVFNGVFSTALNGGTINLSSTGFNSVGMFYHALGAGTDSKHWATRVGSINGSSNFYLSAHNDAFDDSANALVIQRTGLTITSIALTSNALTWNGDALLTTATLDALEAPVVITGNKADTDGAATVNLYSETGTFGEPALRLQAVDATADQGNWEINVNGTNGSFILRTWNDAFSSGRLPIQIARSGEDILQMAFGSQGTIAFLSDDSFSVNAPESYIDGNLIVTADFLESSDGGIVHIVASSGESGPAGMFFETVNAATDEALWALLGDNSGDFILRAYSDDYATSNDAITVSRTAEAVDAVTVDAKTSINADMTLAVGGGSLNLFSDSGPGILFHDASGGLNNKYSMLRQESSGALTLAMLTDAFGVQPVLTCSSAAGGPFLTELSGVQILLDAGTVITLDAGQIVATGTTFTWNGDNVLTSNDFGGSVEQGSYAAETVGLATELTCTVHYLKLGDWVHIHVAVIGGSGQGTSDTTGFSLTGTNTPASLIPTVDAEFIPTPALVDSGTAVENSAASMTNTGAIVFAINLDSAGFTASGFKGFTSNLHTISFVYRV